LKLGGKRLIFRSKLFPVVPVSLAFADAPVMPHAEETATMIVSLNEQAIARAVREAKQANKRIELVDKVQEGLRARVTPSGAVTWALGTRDRESRLRRYTLGNHPAMGVAEAREEARLMRVKVREAGADPIAERKRERVVARDAKDGIGTLTALLDDYAAAEGSQLKSWAECRRRIESVFAAYLKRPLERLALVDLQHTADHWPSAQSAAAAVRYIRPVLKWAAHRRLVGLELTTIRPPATVGRRDRVLSKDELAKLLPVLATSDRPYAACLRLIMLTLTRREEASTALWGHVDLESATWTIPETKNGQPHVLPLSRQAVTLLHTLLPKDKHGNPTKAAATRPVFATATGGALCNWDRETKAIMKDSGTGGWTRHDLRRTGATRLGEAGVPPHVIEAALNHTSISSQLAATYNKSRYRPEVTAALQLLADDLDSIAAPKSPT
jgi:integrase